MARTWKSSDRVTPPGMVAVQGKPVNDKGGDTECLTCGAKVTVDTDGRGNMVEWEWRGGVHPGFHRHRCGR